MQWVKSYGSKYHLAKEERIGHKWSYCGVVLLKDPVEDVPENDRCKICAKKASQ